MNDHRAPKITMVRGNQCPDRKTCPGVHLADIDPGGAYVIGKRVTDPAVLEAFAEMIGSDEVLNRVPIELIPEVNPS